MGTAPDRLLPFAFEPLPLGSIKPQGWLYDTLRLMGDGLAGHELDFYHYVNDTPWIGGKSEYSPLGEAGPYWFNYIVPLAYGLDDDRLKGQTRTFLTLVLDRQHDDGWLGPETKDENRDLWARFPFVLGLIQLVEADPTYKHRVLPALRNFVKLTNSMLNDDFKGLVEWGKARAYDMVLALQWMHENDPGCDTELTFDTMELLSKGAWDWQKFFSEEQFPKGDMDKLPSDGIPPGLLHVVNLGQGLKSSAVLRRLNHSPSLLETARNAVKWTYQYHGSPAGAIVGDERISGIRLATNTKGRAELCAVVEAMYSLSYLYHAIGDNTFADRCELAAFNALPTMTTSDFWAHQYVSQANQPFAAELEEVPFADVGARGLIFGLEPNYPCCTVNHPQGFPKFLSASFVKVGHDGVGHALLSPGKVATTLKGDNNVTISCETNYPFDNVLSYTITAQRPFKFHLRVPTWHVSEESHITLNDMAPQSLSLDDRTGMQELSIEQGTTFVSYRIGARPVIEHRKDETIAIRHGALLYALEIGMEITSTEPKQQADMHPLPDSKKGPRDYTMESTTPWAVAIDPSSLQFYRAGDGSPASRKLPKEVFHAGAPPTHFTAKACEIEWGFHKGVATTPPPPGSRKCIGEPFEVRLVPHGSAKIHMAELPTIDLASRVRHHSDGQQEALADSKVEL
ncbi:MAG: hypothetical protein M1833_005640 [Piccolia ochrophora]|nr:MAG: hypothetical protein M1833_005640 [Piccolia ochrophora]